MPRYHLGNNTTEEYTTLADVKRAVEAAVVDFLQRYDYTLVKDRHGHAVKEIGVDVKVRPH